MKPLVSIAVLTYNHEEFIRETLNSIIYQNYENYQIIIGDDYSTDSTRKILLEYKEQLGSKLILILNERNIGITNNSNAILEKCEGKYICWIGGDDIFLPGKLEKQVEYMENNPELAISYHNIEVFESDTNKVLGYFNTNSKYEGEAELFIKHGCFCGACSVMHRKSMSAKTFNPRIAVASDWLYWIQTSYNGKIGYIDSILSRYRRHKNNVTSNRINSILQENILTLKILEEDKYFTEEQINMAYSRVFYSSAIRALVNDDDKVLYYINNSIKHKIINYKQVIIYIVCKLKIQKVISGYFKKRMKY